MDTNILWQTLIAILGSLGGLEFVKWIYNRKTHSRLADAEADGAEFRNLQATTEFLQAQLQAKEERFADQTTRLRQIQDDLFSEREKRHEAEIQLALKRCDDQECPFRLPPNAYTPPRKGLTRNKYHELKQVTNLTD